MPFVEWRETVEGLVEPVSAQNLLKCSSPGAGCEPVETCFLCGPCSSSLDVAWHLFASGSLEIWDSVICLSQWAGRGQMRRAWMSFPGNLYAAWRWPVPPKGWDTLLPLVAGYVIQDFFAGQGIDLQIKWPNDLLFEGRKIGGILIEEKQDVILVGVGINLVSSPDRDMLRNDTCMSAGNLAVFFSDADFVPLWAKLVSRGRSCYTSLFTSYNPSGFASHITPLLAFIHQNVRVITGEDEHHARLVGLYADGGLVLESHGTREVLYSGSILPLA
ncbi:MAG: biotin--[acetyl-CoA-carboxylase] ligase [Desulfoplanes sp.]|nr:biotin--[acetyl-CoA-carboxylase] ligase [Desulfoplanes sp.]